MSGRRLERLGPDHRLGGFHSANEALDRWLHVHALASQEMDVARSFLAVEGERVVGYFSLTMGLVSRAKALPALVRGLPGYPVGMVLLARLAVDAPEQGRGLGALLLAKALRKAVVAGEAAAARLIVVDAIDEAAARFYAHYGFITVPDHPRRLYRRMNDVRASQ